MMTLVTSARLAHSAPAGPRVRLSGGHPPWRARLTRWLGYLLLAVGEGMPQRQEFSARVTATTGGGDFEAFFYRHQHDIYTYIWRLTSDEGAAADLTQETFLRAWQHFGKVRDYEQPGGWLFRVATNLAFNHLRQRRAPIGAAVPLMGHDSVADDPARGVVEGDQVRRALMSLAPRQRAALVLREVHGLSCEEVAAALGIAPGATRTLLWRARDEFRARYRGEEGLR